MSLDSVFVRDGDRFLATELALGPWAEGALHGGAPAALFGHAFLAAAPEGLRPGRVTIEFVRPVPVGPLAIAVDVVRPGRRVTLLDATMTDPDDVVVARARSLLLAPSTLSVDALEPPPFRGPQDGVVNDWTHKTPMFATAAMEISFVEGVFRQVGPATAWFRLRHPLIAGEPTAPLERVLAAADFGNGIASVLSWEEHTFINPDLTVHLEREPAGAWVALQSRMRVHEGSIASAESVLFDERGRIGHATQALLVAKVR